MRSNQILKSNSGAKAITIVVVMLSAIGLFQTASALMSQSLPTETQLVTETSPSAACASEAPAYDATTGAISVLVLDFNTSAPISGAAVYVWQKGATGSADYSQSTVSTGYANISYVTPGEYDLWIVAYSGNYQTNWAYANVKPQQIVNITVYLQHWPSSTQGGQDGLSSNPSAGLILVAVIFIPLAVIAAIGWTATRTSAQDSNVESPSTPTRETEKGLAAPTRFTCRYCGSDVIVLGSKFCWNCGASLQRTKETTVSPVRNRGKRLGRKCMVCELELSSGDEIVYCPHCGNAAHRDHMLEWLHVKGICPVCNQHLDERELKTRIGNLKPARRRTESPK